MTCGVKWKGCECPWFSYDAIENDRFEHMNVPAADVGRAPPPRHATPPPPRRATPPPENYEEEIARQREQVQRDEELARRLASLDDDEYLDFGNARGVRNAGGHHMNEDYRPPYPLPAMYERSPPARDYVSGVSRTRGMEDTYEQQRLADRFSGYRHFDDRAMPPPPPPMRMHPPPSPIRTHPPQTSMRMHPPPPPPPPPMVARPHVYEADMYRSAPPTRSPERVVAQGYNREVRAHPPSSRSREEPKQSSLAGLNSGRGANRVFEWRTHVPDGEPDAR